MKSTFMDYYFNFLGETFYCGNQEIRDNGIEKGVPFLEFEKGKKLKDYTPYPFRTVYSPSRNQNYLVTKEGFQPIKSLDTNTQKLIFESDFSIFSKPNLENITIAWLNTEIGKKAFETTKELREISPEISPIIADYKLYAGMMPCIVFVYLSMLYELSTVIYSEDEIEKRMETSYSLECIGYFYPPSHGNAIARIMNQMGEFPPLSITAGCRTHDYLDKEDTFLTNLALMQLKTLIIEKFINDNYQFLYNENLDKFDDPMNYLKNFRYTMK